VNNLEKLIGDPVAGTNKPRSNQQGFIRQFSGLDKFLGDQVKWLGDPHASMNNGTPHHVRGGYRVGMGVGDRVAVVENILGGGLDVFGHRRLGPVYLGPFPCIVGDWRAVFRYWPGHRAPPSDRVACDAVMRFCTHASTALSGQATVREPSRIDFGNWPSRIN